MKKITLLLLIFFSLIMNSQDFDVAIITNSTSDCENLFGAKASLNASDYETAISVLVALKDENGNIIESTLFSKSEYTSFEFGKFVYEIPSQNITTSNADIIFADAILYGLDFVGPLIPIITPIAAAAEARYRCPNDFDRDGILNCDDSCPNDYNSGNDSDGDGIDDVCDSNDNPDINLTVCGLRVFVGTSEYNIFNGSEPLLVENELVRFRVTISNEGDFIAESSEVDVLFSVSENAYPDASGLEVVSLDRGNMGSISGNGSKTEDFQYTFSNFVGGIQLSDLSRYVVFIHVDYDNEISETDESNFDNIIAFSVKYDDIFGSPISGGPFITPQKRGSAILPSNDNPINKIDNNVITSYEVEIFDLHSGTKLATEKVNQNYNEKSIIANLPKGFYIIKTPFKNYKISRY